MRYTYKVNLDDDTAAGRLLRLVGTGKAVLEIGCASGTQTRVLREQLGCTVTAIEINADAAQKAFPYCHHLIIGDIEAPATLAQLGSSTFDVIVLADVLEHLRNPRLALCTLKSYLADDGYVVASIPNIVHASVVYEMARGSFNYQPEGLLDETHIRFFTKQSILETFENSGYVVDKLERVVVNPSATEYHTRPVTREDQAMLDYIVANNAEARTYQFVLRAMPATRGAGQLSAAAVVAQDTIARLESIIDSQNKRMQELESDVKWIKRNRVLRLLRFWKRLFSKREKS
jgi:2-polyprenyl-3-methyl-5-hydroxy-6-metoxy-1,4-benzoquinol methylase